MKKALNFILDNDLFKLTILSYTASQVQGLMIFSISIFVNRPRLFHTLYTHINILDIILYALFGLLAAVIIKRRTKLRAFLSGLLLSLMLIFSPLEYQSLSSILTNISGNPHILAPALIFFIIASFVDYGLHKRDRAGFWDKRARALTVGLVLLFLVLLGSRVYQYYSFISSAAYKNSLRAEVPIPSGAQDVVHRISRRWGQQIATFTFATNDRSIEIYEYYDDYCLGQGFSRTGSFNPVWQEEDWMRADPRTSVPGRWHIAEAWENFGAETEAFLYILQMNRESEEPAIQKVTFVITAYPKKYRKWFPAAEK